MQGFSRQRSRKNTPRCTQRANTKNFVHKLGFCGVICSSDLHIVNMHNTDAVWSVCACMPSAPHRLSRDSVSCGVKFLCAAFLCHKVSFSQFLSSPLPLFSLLQIFPCDGCLFFLFVGAHGWVALLC